MWLSSQRLLVCRRWVAAVLVTGSVGARTLIPDLPVLDDAVLKAVLCFVALLEAGALGVWRRDQRAGRRRAVREAVPRPMRETDPLPYHRFSARTEEEPAALLLANEPRAARSQETP